MAPKYIKGQKVIIISVKDQHMHLKYPGLEPFMFESGIIIRSDWVGLEGLDVPRDSYLYTVRIDNKEVNAIPEECLELCVD